MDNYENAYKSICRICLTYNNNKNMIGLVDDDSENYLNSYGKAALTFANISIHKQDDFPTFMCAKCLYLLKQAICFKLLCESNNKCLQNIANSVEKDKIREHVVELTMLKYYFPKECITESNKKKVKRKKIQSKTSELGDRITEKINDGTENNMENNFFNTESLKQDIMDGEMLLDKMESLIDTSAYKHLEIDNPLQARTKVRRKSKKMAVLRNHLEYEKDDNSPLVCTICNKVLRNQLTYKHHMQRHNGCRYICEHCGKGFPVITELQIHLVSRHGTGPYLQCSTCSFKAPRKFDLIEHERLHSGERPYTCEKCGLTFRRRGIWKKHLIYHTEKTVQCPQCPKKFFQKSAMLAHANNIHDRIYVYLCKKCGATYAKTATVRRHMTERHGIPREMQGKIVRVNKVGSHQEQ